LSEPKNVEQLNECLGYYEKHVEVVIETVPFFHVNFVQNTVYGSLSRDKLLQQITLTMQDNVLNTEHTITYICFQPYLHTC
jgi:hypothetical protein